VNVETLPRTLLVAAGVALFCSAIVSIAVHTLRPLQLAFDSLERNRAVLVAANLLPSGEISDREIVARFLDLDARVVDLDTGWFRSGLDAHAYDHWQQRDEDQAAVEAGPGDVPGPATNGRNVPVYLVRKADGFEQIVLPVDGRGMWSAIYGYIGLDEDLNTITGVIFHRHGETPGIGDRIQDRSWLATWQGKQIRDDDRILRFRVAKGASGPFEVDVVSGASVTTEATGEIVRNWLGDDGFGPFLENLGENQR
jgi:Na+-transporting NADH:ubiquinone oxidoreductase subunit C